MYRFPPLDMTLTIWYIYRWKTMVWPLQYAGWEGARHIMHHYILYPISSTIRKVWTILPRRSSSLGQLGSLSSSLGIHPAPLSSSPTLRQSPDHRIIYCCHALKCIREWNQTSLNREEMSEEDPKITNIFKRGRGHAKSMWLRFADDTSLFYFHKNAY